MIILQTIGAIVLIAVVYFLPTAIAHLRNHHKSNAIIALNILLSWTVIGWVVALVWSLTAAEENQS